ncbi:MAG: PfkB family carbohydrate kinase, partial [Cyanobium sp.]
VMVSRTGAVLLEADAVDAYRRLLLPLAELLTPNLHEARLLANCAIDSPTDVERAAALLLELGPSAVLIKGGGLPELRGRDYLLDTTGVGRWLLHGAVETLDTHGTGCTLGAAITAHRARGLSLESAVRAAKAYVEGALRNALAIGAGQGPLCHWHLLL